MISQMDAIVEIKAKIPATVHLTYTRSERNVAETDPKSFV